MKTVLFMIVLFLVALSGATSVEAQQQLPGDVVERYCSVDAAGRRLSVTGAKDIARELLLTESQWEQPADLILVKDYSLSAPVVKKDAAEIAVDYRVLGRIDSSLSLIRLQTPYSSQPVLQSERFSLVFTDTHSEIGPDTKEHAMKAPTEWRIKSHPSQPHVGIQSAMAYVRMMSRRANDIRTKMNAEKTLAELQEMLIAPVAPPESAGPDRIVSQFIETEMAGAGLRTETSAQLNPFLVHPASQAPEKLGVARAYAVKRSRVALNKSTVSVEYGALGEIDSQLQFTSLGERGSIIQQDYKLLFDNKYPAPATGSVPQQEITGPGRWRIAETPPEEWVSVASAIEYVTQMRDSTRDPAIKANADKTLAILARYR